MNLDLVTMAADVEAIAEKATKEAHQENSLTVLQSTWERIEFSVTTSTEADTPLINMSEEDLEVTDRSEIMCRFALTSAESSRFKSLLS